MTAKRLPGRITVVVAAGLLTCGIAAETAAGATTPAPAVTRVARLLPGAPPAGARALGAVAGTQNVSLEVVLAPNNPGGVSSLLAELYQPGSAEYHHWLGRGEFLAQFGPPAAELTAVEAWLTLAGATETRASGFSVSAVLPADQVGSVLGAPLERYRLPSGRDGIRALSPPLIPADLAGDVESILGLDTLAAATPLGLTATPAAHRSPAVVKTVKNKAACPGARQLADAGYLTFSQVGSHYGIDSLVKDGQNGHGQTIGVYELSPASTASVATYKSCFGLTNRVSTDQIDGGGTVSPVGTIEADADIEQVASQAPDATVISYQGPNSAVGAYDVWSTITATDAARVISSSWGICEPDAAQDGQIAAFRTLFKQAATQGQTILVASGDSGPEDCYQTDSLTVPEVSYPASEALVTAVGGTSLLGPGDEVTWNTCQTDESVSCASKWGDQAASGGGISRYVAKPAHQPSVLKWKTAQRCGTSCREVPDISANAGTGMIFYNAGSWSAVGGTSLSAPLLAGLVADKNTGCATATGLWTTTLYALAAQGDYGSALNDITKGNTDMTGSNHRQYAARTGYDLATGLGSPRAQGLACPNITSISPAAGPAGAEVTLTGLGLEKAAIRFGTTAAKIVKETATSATVVVPAGSVTETVSATSLSGTGTSTRAYTYKSKRTARATETRHRAGPAAAAAG